MESTAATRPRCGLVQLIRRKMPRIRLPTMTRTFLILAMAALLHTGGAAAGKLHPVVLVPGNGGNQLEARLTKEYEPSSFFCRLWAKPPENGGGWFRLWFDPLALLRPFTSCFAERMALRFVSEIDDYRNARGVETRVPDFGSTRALRFLDPSLPSVDSSSKSFRVLESSKLAEILLFFSQILISSSLIFRSISEYMETLVQSLEKMGYRDGDDLFGAPYDFRYGLSAGGRPCLVGDRFLADLKQLVETASAAAGKPVVLVAHSLGNLFVLQLLRRSSPAWRRRHVRHLVSLSPPWGGSVVLMLTFASGSTLGAPLVDPLLLRDEQRSSESNAWLLPSPAVFGDRPLVATPARNHSAADMAAFLEDIGYTEGVEPYETRIVPLVEEVAAAPPEVPVTCVVGTGVKTPEMLIYGKGGFDRPPEMVYGDGDGTVNLASLMALRSDNNGTVKFVKVAGVSHTDVLKDAAAIAEITGEIAAINSAAPPSLSSVVSQSLSL